RSPAGASQERRDRVAGRLVAELAGRDPGVGGGAAPVLREEGPPEVVERLHVAGVLVDEERVDVLGVLVALRGQVGGAEVRPGLHAVRVQLHRPLEAGDGGGVVALLVGRQAGPQVGARVGGARLDDGAELVVGGAVVAEAVVRAAGDEPGGGDLLGVAEAARGALGVGQRLAGLRELVVGGGQRDRAVRPALPALLLGPRQGRERLLRLAALEARHAAVVRGLPRGRVGRGGEAVRLGGVGLAAEAALQRAQLDQRAGLSGAVARGPCLLEGALERPDRVVDLALGHVYVGDE